VSSFEKLTNQVTVIFLALRKLLQRDIVLCMDTSEEIVTPEQKPLESLKDHGKH
jgi:hypothetical protein